MQYDQIRRKLIFEVTSTKTVIFTDIFWKQPLKMFDEILHQLHKENADDNVDDNGDNNNNNLIVLSCVEKVS